MTESMNGDCSRTLQWKYSISTIYTILAHFLKKSSNTQTYFSNSSFFNTLSPFGPAGPTPPGRPGTPCGNNTRQEEEENNWNQRATLAVSFRYHYHTFFIFKQTHCILYTRVSGTRGVRTEGLWEAKFTGNLETGSYRMICGLFSFFSKQRQNQ